MKLDVRNHLIPRDVIRLLCSDRSLGVDISDGWWRGPDHVPFQLLEAFYDPAARLAALERAGLAAFDEPAVHLVTEANPARIFVRT